MLCRVCFVYYVVLCLLCVDILCRCAQPTMVFLLYHVMFVVFVVLFSVVISMINNALSFLLCYVVFGRICHVEYVFVYKPIVMLRVLGDSLSGHDGFPFSTYDVDNDSKADGSCARYVKGAWWFHDCFDSCLTCAYQVPGTNDCQSMTWNSHQYCTALTSAQMMVRPI